MIEQIIEVITYIVLAVITVIISIKNYKLYKESKDGIEKALYWITALCIATPYVIYLLDRYNIPSLFNYTNNIDTSDWLGFLGTYFTTIVGTLISSIVLIVVTKVQIERTYKDNDYLNKESQRIQNLPYLQYSFSDDIENINEKIITLDNSEQHGSVQFSLKIKNIGLNSVRKIYMSIEAEFLKDVEIVELVEQSCIAKDEVIKKGFSIYNLPDGNYIIFMIIYYQDLMKNWYEQKIKLNLQATNFYDNNKRQCPKNFIVYDENKIENMSEILTKYLEMQK